MAKMTMRSLAAAALLCASGPALAEEGEGLFKSLFKAAGLATDVPPPKDFVSATRPDPAASSYAPLHERPQPRPVKVLTPAEAEARKAELDALRAAHDRVSARVPAPFLNEPWAKKAGVRKPPRG